MSHGSLKFVTDIRIIDQYEVIMWPGSRQYFRSGTTVVGSAICWTPCFL